MSIQLSRSTAQPRLILAIVILLTAVCAPVNAQQRRPANSQFSQSSTESATTVFRAARDLITDGEWAKAQAKFSEYVSKYQNEKNLDAALYWLAYAQYKLENFGPCRETINKLFEKYKESEWLDDARVLWAQVPGAIAIATSPAAAMEVDQAIALTRAMATTPIAPGVTTVYAPGSAINTVGSMTPLPAQMATSEVYIDPDRLVSGVGENDDDPCEFKIVVP